MEKFNNWFSSKYEFTTKGKIKQIGSYSYPSPKEVYQNYKDMLETLGIACDVSYDDALSVMSPSKNEEKKKTPPREYINQWLTTHANEWYISPAWKEIKYTNFGVSTYKDLENLRTAIMADIYNNSDDYGVDAIKATLQHMAMNGYQTGLATVVAELKYDEKLVDAGERWLKAMYDYFKPTESYDIFATLMKHWAWQVKRKMNDKAVKNHIWLNFYGAAGLGKTTALNKIAAPINDFVSTTSISKLFDDTKEIRRLTENFILIFDEMAVNVESEASGGRLSADQKAILKSIVTGDKLDARVYGTQEQAKRKITFSCISSANEHLYDVIYDDTTMRRFFDFNCTGTRPASFDEINKFLDNSIYFWRSIDENKDEGYFSPDNEIGKQISTIQSSYYPTKTTSKMWSEAVNARPGKGKIEDAYRAYAQWCRDTGNKGKALQYFTRDIQHIFPNAARTNGRIYLDFDTEQYEPVFESSSNLINYNQQTPFGLTGSDDVMSFM